MVNCLADGQGLKVNRQSSIVNGRI
jgi:hypothetical protein